MLRRVAVLAVLGAGCHGDETALTGDDTEAPRYESVCGAAGPVELLALEDGEYAYALDWAPGHDRVLVGTYRVEGLLGDSPGSDDRRIVAVDPCGGGEAVVGEGLDVVQPYGELALACTVDGDALYRIDPTGASAPVLVLDGTCAVRRTDEGLVAIVPDGEGTGTLVIVRDPAAASPTTAQILGGVALASNPFFGESASATPLWAKGSEALALTADGSVLSFDLVDGTPALVLDGVLDFRASGDGRRLLWQTADALEGDPPASPVFVHDRDTEHDTYLMATHLPWTAAPFRDAWVVVRDDSSLGQRLFDAAGEELVLPEGTALRAVLSEGRFWLARSVDGGTEELLWIPGSEPRVVITHHLGLANKVGEGIEVYLEDEVPAPLEGGLMYGSFEGGVERWSARVHFHHRVLSDGRILSIVDENANAHGPLRLENPATGTITLVDPAGYVHSPSLNVGDPFDGDVVYATDDGGEHHALMRARIKVR